MVYHNYMTNIFTIEIRHHLSLTRPDTMQTRHTVSRKVEKWFKRGYSDYYCKRPLCSKYLFGFSLTVFLDSVVFFTSSATSLQWSQRLSAGYLQCKVRLMYCMVLLFCIWRGFEAIVIFGGCSDSLVFLLIHSLYTTAEPARNRSLTNFLKSTVM